MNQFVDQQLAGDRVRREHRLQGSIGGVAEIEQDLALEGGAVKGRVPIPERLVTRICS